MDRRPGSLPCRFLDGMAPPYLVCIGTRVVRRVRAWSAIERVIAWRIHQVRRSRTWFAAAVLELVDRLHQAMGLNR